MNFSLCLTAESCYYISMEEAVKKFISNPESFTLFRGENKVNKGGLHFTLDEKWARNFGDEILTLKLPVGSKIKVLKKEDFEEGYKSGIVSEASLWDSIFKNNFDAIVGHDAMNGDMLDVIVNPKHLKAFRILSGKN